MNAIIEIMYIAKGWELAIYHFQTEVAKISARLLMLLR